MVRSSDMMMFWMFAEKIKTEWIILNIIIWTILLMTLTSTNPKDIKNNLINLRENLLNRNKYSFTLSFTIFIGPYCRNKNHIDTSILGILHYITQNKIDIKNKCSFEISKNKYSSDGEISENKQYVFYMPNDNNKFLLKVYEGSKIYCKFIRTTKDLTDSKSDATESEHIQIILTNDENSEKIQEFIKHCKSQFIEFTTNELDKSLKIFEPIINVGKNVYSLVSYNEYECKTTKDLIKNLFFKGKPELIRLIDNFINNKEYYESLGLPYQLGFLFHGEPGLGKTATIKAISKYLNRHIIRIDLSTIYDIDALREIFYSDKVNDYQIPPEKCIYVIEEADDFEILHSRSKKEKKSCESPIAKSEDDDLLTQVVKMASKNTDYPGRKKAVKLSNFLELLDGIVEKPGRIIIMTTNYPDRLDSAFIRPGRIDWVHEFQNADLETCESIIGLAFGIEELDLGLPKEIDGKYSPAEIHQLCIKYNHSFKEFMDNI